MGSGVVQTTVTVVRAWVQLRALTHGLKQMYQVRSGRLSEVPDTLCSEAPKATIQHQVMVVCYMTKPEKHR